MLLDCLYDKREKFDINLLVGTVLCCHQSRHHSPTLDEKTRPAMHMTYRTDSSKSSALAKDFEWVQYRDFMAESVFTENVVARAIF